ncbi:NADP-dependent oxidoreductase domain-containing protein [Aspergillus caelatus]|uniref:NADP-dependent oxidoreductase domain-containing protein n=1 Tax=Aspergillus caelatus TaxID=61420 RepID=A0A5N7A5Z3_9EURO|nr:NADP-dependent oxidoreductase domain-containing protein [Aspergillus caelatus]KAE8365023.1 NADP-dependent oxidoreductase domain-containing protein [Aspergillus caelatus]
MSIFAPAPKPASFLGYHRVLAPSAGIKVSPLCLGTMNFGTTWKDFMGECSKEQSFALLDAFYKLGGNFLDTANNYQQEESEIWIGEWMKERRNRDQMVIATKYTTGFRTSHRDTEPIQSNFRSLNKLQADYIDLLYVHWWDFTSSVEEVMHGLNNLVNSGKVLYLGVSDTPAWVVVNANEYARVHGLRPFSVYQAPLGQGKFKSSEARSGSSEDGSGRASNLSEDDIKVSDALEQVAKRKNTTLHAIALAYVMHKTPSVFPIVGQRKVEHLKANVEALSVSLSDEDLAEIDSSSSFDIGFPMNFIFRDSYTTNITAADVSLTRVSAHIDALPNPSPVRPRHVV